MVVNNGLIINFTCNSGLHDASWTFPVAFTSLNYVIPTIYWIDQIEGIDTSVKSCTSITLTCVVRHSFNPTGCLAIGY